MASSAPPAAAADAIVAARRAVAAVRMQTIVRGAIKRTWFTKARPSLTWAARNRRVHQQRERRKAASLASKDGSAEMSDVDRAVAVATRKVSFYLPLHFTRIMLTI
jgi:hypothetical protein